MLRIYKDNDVKVVTNGVYNSLYKPLGYKPVIESKPITEKKPVNKTITPVAEKVTNEGNEKKVSVKKTKKGA